MLPDIKRILYATDLGPGAPYVFRFALKLATQNAATITAIHAVEPLGTFGQSLVELHVSHEQSEQMHEQARNQIKERLEERIKRLCTQEAAQAPGGAELVESIHVREGQPAATILAEARGVSADLIVMGTHRRTAIGEALLGTTASKVLHGSETPVLLIRIPEGYREEGF